MFQLPKNVWILTLSTALFMSLSVFMVFVGGIIGDSLTPVKSLSTLPVALGVVGTAFTIIPVIRLMSLYGRSKVFLGVCTYTIALIMVSIASLTIGSFVLFCLVSFGFGVTFATMYQFRFAAIESVKSDQRATAAAVVLLGGLASAYLGTEAATLGRDWFSVEFVGSFLLLALLMVVAFILLLFFKPAKKFSTQENRSKRSLSEIIKQSVFLIAVSSAITGYVAMSFIMTATPVSMHIMDGFSLEQTKHVIQSHVVAMFLPSLLTALIVKYIGISRMMLAGVILLFSAIIVAYIDRSLGNYWLALILLGLGWNFLFIGGTSLLPRAYNENEKYKVQSINDFLIFGFQAIAALSAGWFVFNYSWELTLLSVIPLLIAQLLLTLWWLKHDA
ncbi:MAG: MFS transporter [Gammaproteobacteria bacterium]